MEQLKAIFFDMDGTIIDTEKDGHRIAFNQAFAQYGINAEWDISKYHQLLQIAGGKERMKFYFQHEGKKYLPEGTSLVDLVQNLHLLKTELFISLIENGKLPLRPGIKRIMKEANEKNILVGICTTSNEKAVKVIINSLLGDIKIDLVLAGDIVSHKKPDPEIYLLALQKTNLSANEVVVVEDSENGVIAAKNAGLTVFVTVNEYTRDENLSLADAVVTSLGDNLEKTQVLAGNLNLKNTQKVNISHLMALLNPMLA
ncbi:MAG: HAD-IA family hydrolase [Mariniphaga sp.]|nr:HAD-IA family hydrolase [Mariniphaga sp.]